MKKLLVTIIMVVLSSALWGCSPQDKCQYNEKTNQHVLFHGVNLQVPEAWKESSKDDEYVEYVELKSNGDFKNCLAITFNQEVKLKERIAGIKYGLESSAKQYGNIDNIKQSSISIANIPAEKVEYGQKLGQEEGKGEIIVIQAKKGVIEISFYSPEEMGHDDFTKVLESITLTEH